MRSKKRETMSTTPRKFRTITLSLPSEMDRKSRHVMAYGG